MALKSVKIPHRKNTAHLAPVRMPAPKEVLITMDQHIGAPAKAIVKEGESVTRGQMIAEPAEGLSVGIHASISGKVVAVSNTYVIIKKSK